tara:strand:+ start:857 stop:1312 length:456 start_codon:yes stop_codon:yes gene_type:complete
MKKILIITLIFCSCNFFNEEKNNIPENLISEEKMINIIYDMSLISVSKGINKRILENNGMKPKTYILNKYKIDSLQFVNSNEYYSTDLEKYLYIYESVLTKLELNKEIVIDTIEKIRAKRAERSKQIILEGQKNDSIDNSKNPYRSVLLKN